MDDKIDLILKKLQRIENKLITLNGKNKIQPLIKCIITGSDDKFEFIDKYRVYDYYDDNKVHIDRLLINLDGIGDVYFDCVCYELFIDQEEFKNNKKFFDAECILIFWNCKNIETYRDVRDIYDIVFNVYPDIYYLSVRVEGDLELERKNWIKNKMYEISKEINDGLSDSDNINLNIDINVPYFLKKNVGSLIDTYLISCSYHGNDPSIVEKEYYYDTVLVDMTVIKMNDITSLKPFKILYENVIANNI